MEDPALWLNNGKSKKTSKFINHILKPGEKFIGIYKAVNKTENKFGKTFHYIIGGPGGDVIFDSKNPRIAQIFTCMSFGSRVSIKKAILEGKIRYLVSQLNTLHDEEALASEVRKFEREGKREENKRDERLDEKEIGVY